MKRSSMKRILSMICVVALMLGMVSTSAFAAVPMMSGDVVETPVTDPGHSHSHVVPERPAAQVGAQKAPTYEEPSAQLMATGGTWTPPSGFAVSGNVTSSVGDYTLNFAKNGGSGAIQSAPGGTAIAGKIKMTVNLEKDDKITVSYNVVNSGATGLEAKSVTLGGTTVSTTKQDAKPSTITYKATAAGPCELSATGYLAIYSITIDKECSHSWDAGVVTTPATCTTEGVKTFTCSLCGNTKTEPVTKTPHSYTVEKEAQVNATCGKAGKTAVMQCATCTATQGGEVIPATGAHSWGADGKCTVCQMVNPEMCQHTNKASVPHKDATCTEDGVQGGEYCADCGEGKAAAETVIPATGHHYVDGVCSCGDRETTGFIAESGWLESAYATWAITPGVTSYNAYVAPAGTESWTKLDNELIREYPGYMRVDALGLAAGSYKLKIVDNNGKEMITNDLSVEAHDRSGFAFVNGTASGAYNDDGTLKSNAQVIYVTTGSDVESYQSSEIWNNTKDKFTSNPVCVRVIGHVKLSHAMGFQGWTTGLTVEGVGNDALLEGGGVFVKGSSNVEVRNLGIKNVPSSGKNDLIAIEQTNDHVWAHNNDLFYGFSGGGDQAKGDGSLDVKDAEYCSFSYNHFWDSGKASLLGNSSTENYITYHHNWFDHSDSRHPRTRSGNVHVYNNYYDGVSKYGVGTTGGCGACSVFVEANYFRNTKYPILNSKQASDSNGSGGTNTFSGDGPGFNKAYNNVMVGSKNFVSQKDDPSSFDAYVVATRDEKVPSSVSAGGATYSNFDTSGNIGVTAEQVQDPKDALLTITKYAGRVGGGDIKWEFDDATEDENYAVIPELSNMLDSYKTTLVSVGGTVTNPTAAEHTHRAGTWLTTKAPGCDPATKKVVNGEETQYCVDCGEVLATRSIPGAHSNDGTGVCTVCGEKVANGGGPAADPNAKILKASDFKDLAKNDAVTQAMLDEKYGGYFQSAGTGMKAGQSSSTNPVTDCLSLPNTGNGGVSFTVTNGPATVSVKASSTGKGKSSVMELKDTNGTAVADKNGATSITVKENVSAATTVTYTLPAGTYTLYSAAGQTNGVRLIQLSVSEAEASCEHANKTHTAAVEAKCLVDGNVEYWTCTECSKTFSDEACTKEITDVVVKQLGHDMQQSAAAVPATCLVDGKTAVMKCSRCDVTTGGEVVKAPGSHAEATRVKAGTETTATCTTPGSFTEETYCTRCGEVLGESVKTGVLAPHKLTATAAKTATCVSTGNIAYWTCSECSKKFSDAAGKNEVTGDVTIPVDANNHVGGTEVKNAKPATSTEDGYTGDTCCKSCGVVITKGETIPAITGPMSKLLKGSDQDTCAGILALGKDVTVKGWATDGQSFKMGGNDTVKDFFTVYYSANSKIDTTEKTWDFEGNYYTTGVETKESRFNLGGKADPSKMKNLIAFTTTKPATVKVWWVQAGGNSVGEDGTVTAGTPRQIAIWKSTDTKNVLQKTNSSANKNDAQFDTFTLAAEGTYYLGGVETNYLFMVEVIEEGDIARTWNKPTTPVDPDPPTACTHANKTRTAPKAATCTEAGNIEYWTCPDCEKMFSDEACTTEVTTVTTSKLGHDMKEVANSAKDATCTADGKEADKKCSRCDHTETGKTITKLGHTPGEAKQENVQGASCTVAGSYDEVVRCTVCNEIITSVHKDGVTLPHDMKEVEGTAKAATCTADGKAADKKCANCDHTETGAVIAKLGHDMKEVPGSAKAPTATTAGKQADKKCSRCDYTEQGAVIPATGGGSRPSGGGSSRPVVTPPVETIDDQKTPLAGGPQLNTKDHIAYITGYVDGTVGAERNLTRQETAMIFYRLLTEQSKEVYGTDQNSFSDIDASHWANRAISTLANAGIIKGLPDGTFGGELTISRAEFVTIAARFYAVTKGEKNPFPDVDGHWAEEEILFAYDQGWVKGLPNGTFGPDKLITRAEAMRIINNVLGRKTDDAKVIEGAKDFRDVSEDAWYYYDVLEATTTI